MENNLYFPGEGRKKRILGETTSEILQTNENMIVPVVDTKLGTTYHMDASNIGGSNESVLLKTDSGYSQTGAFAGKPLSNQYVWEAGVGIQYTSADVAAGKFKVLSLDDDVHLAVDNPYWTTPDVSSDPNVGLFNGNALPQGVSSLFDFTYDYDTENANITHQYYALNNGTETGYEGSVGRIILNELQYGDLLEVRFDFNVIPQIANTTVEPAIWYSNRNENDEITFSFELTKAPIFYGTGTVGKTYLNRIDISAWIASSEDLNALALPAIKADNPVIIQPLGLLVIVKR